MWRVRGDGRVVGMSRPVIEISDLRVSYGSVAAVNGITVQVNCGEVFGVLGPNGAGKTTTVETAIGLRRPTSGTVRVLGLDPQRDSAALRQRVGAQLQQAVLPNRLKVKEAMAVYASAYDDPADPDGLLADWGLAEQRNKSFGSLSGGQRQRLFIALALLGRPEIVMLDELTTGLDPAARRDTWAMVQALRAGGVTVLLVTHSMEEAETLCDRLVVIDHGRVVAAGTPEQVRGEHRSLEAAYLELTAPAFGTFGRSA